MLSALRLSAVFTLLGLLTSRVALILHELLGHALTAKLVGSETVRWKLFWFAGGYVSFRRQEAYETPERLFISLGGIGVELVLAGAGFLLARRLAGGSLARFAVIGFSSVVLVHALFYLTTGAFHGYGDGWLLHRELGSARPFVVALGCLLAVASAYAVGRTVAAGLDGWLAAHRRAVRMVIIVAAIVVGGGVHGALTYGELQVRRNQTYSKVMQPQSQRNADRELARYLEAMRARGAVMSKRQVAEKRTELREEHRRFPLRIVLGIAVGLAALFGAWRRLGGGAEDAPPPPRSIAWLALATVLSIAAVGLITALSG